MTFKHLSYLALALILLFIGVSFLHTFAFPDPAWKLDKGERVTVSPGEVLSQTFISSQNGLRRIEILFGKFTLEADDRLAVELRDSSCSSLIAQETLSGRSYDSEHTHSFIFDRISDSKDKAYCLTFTFATDRPVAKGKSPRLFIDKAAPGSPYAFLNQGGGKEVGAGPIAIRPGYTHDSFSDNAKEFFERISQYKPLFLKNWFLIAFALGGLALTFLAIMLLIKEEE